MTEVYEHNPGDHDDPSPSPTLLVGVVGTLLLVATVMGTTALYYNVKAKEVFDEVIKPERVEPVEHYRPQQAFLDGPARWIERDEQGETVRAFIIPIERAMELVVLESGKGSR